jgi:putative FmdB family regulatory protein
MPMYEYKCPKCKETYDIHVTLDVLDNDILCPICNTVLKRKEFYPVPGRVH